MDPPDWLMNVYRAGKCRGLRELHELRRLHDLVLGRVENFVASVELVSRGNLAAFQADIEAQEKEDTTAARVQQNGAGAERDLSEPRSSSPSEASPPLQPRTTEPVKRASVSLPVVVGTLEGMNVRVLTESAPEQGTHVFVVLDGGEGQRSVPIAALQGLRLER